MPNTISLKRRIGSVKNTKQITKAMELVSASKMRRAQQQAKLSRDYQTAAYSLLNKLNGVAEVETQPLFQKRAVKSKLYLVVTSDSGLAGAYNSNILKMFTKSLLADQAKSIKSSAIIIGKQGAQYVRRLKNLNLLAVYQAFGDHPSVNDIRPILNTVLDEYRSSSADAVVIIFTKFISNLVQEAKQLTILPASSDEATASKDGSKFFTNFEPSVEAVIDGAASRLIEVQIWQALLESLASEHSMRMLAMKNATDNANDIIDDLTLEFNTARQASITQELAEISGGVEALKE